MSNPLRIVAPDLRSDPEAAFYVKDETVRVAFALSEGVVASREGPNRYLAGDALVTGSTGDRWSVSRARFDARYQPEPPLCGGQDGLYRSLPIPVHARQIAEDFIVLRSAGGDLLQGKCGDWLLQYAPGDWGVVENGKFLRVYRR
jgi:hypothetical protein